MRIGFYLGNSVRVVAKAAIPVTKWASSQAASFTTEFVRGMSEQPTLVNNNIDEELKQELSSEPVQPELPLEHPEQPARQS